MDKIRNITFLIGAQKAGTTNLAYLLGQHKGIALSNPKEPDFFTKNYNTKTLDWYLQCFSDEPDGVFLDASTSYSAAPLDLSASGSSKAMRFSEVPERIYGMTESPKFIYLLRDPVLRAYSLYWHEVRAGNEKKLFRDTLTTDSKYLRIGDYYGQLNLYLEHFPLDSFMFVCFEDMVKNPEKTALKCLQFIGLDTQDFTPKARQGKNKGFRLNRLGSILHAGGVTRIASKIIPSAIKAKLSCIITQNIPPISMQDEEWLAQYYFEKNQKLEELIKIPLSHWKKPLKSTSSSNSNACT